MTYSINGLALTEVELTLPLHGIPVADVLTDSPNETLVAGSPVTLLFGDLTIMGTVLRGNASFGTNRLRIAAGHGGIGRLATPQGWNDATYRQIAQTLLSSVGETLSPTATAPALAGLAQFWTVLAEPAGLALSRIVNALGLQWRMLTDGTVWIGTDLFAPTVIAPSSATLIQTMPEQGRDWYGVDSPVLLPGSLFGGRRVSDVLYRLHRHGDDEQTLRMSVLYSD